MAIKTARQRYDDYLKLVNKNKTNNLEGQIANAQTRITDAGGDLDTRNPIEKLFNVKKDQNVLFDIMEIINRPQQAMFGAIKAGQEGRSLGEGALEGLKGDDYTYFGEILRNAGMKDSGEDKVGLDDVVGVTGDILLDPMNLAFGLGAASKVKGVSKLVKGADVISDTNKVIGTLGDGGKILNKSGKVTHFLDTASGMAKPIKKDLTQRAFGAIGDFAVKPAAKLVDKTVEKGLKFNDSLAGIKYANPDAKLAQDLGKILPEGIKPGTDIKGALELYKDTKESFKSAFNVAKSLPDNLWNKLKGSEAGVRVASEEATALGKYVDNAITDYSTKTDVPLDTLQRQLYLMTENNLDQTFKARDLVDGYKKNTDNIIRVADVDKPALEQILTKLKDKDVDILNYKKLPNGDYKITKVKLKNAERYSNVLDELDNMIFNKRIDLSDSDKQLLDSALKDKNLMNFYNSTVEPSYRQVSEIFKRNTGVDFSPITSRKGYLHRTLNEGAQQNIDRVKQYSVKSPRSNNAKEFKARKYDNAAARNARSGEISEQGKLKLEASIKRQEDKLSDNKLRRLTNDKIKAQMSLDTKLGKIKTRLDDLDVNLKQRADKILDYETKRTSIVNRLNVDNLKRFEKIATTKELESIVDATKKGTLIEKQLDDVLSQLGTEGLNNAKAKQLLDKAEVLNRQLLASENKLYDIFNTLETNKMLSGVKSAKKTLQTVENTNAYTKFIMKQEFKSKELKELQKVLGDSIEDTISKKTADIRYLDSQIKKIDPTKDAQRLHTIDRMKRDLEYLKTQEVQELFNMNYSESLFDFIENISNKQAPGIRMMNDVLFDTAMGDEKLMRIALPSEAAPLGYKKISANSIIKEMDSWNDIFKTERVQEFMAMYKDTDIILDKRLANMVLPEMNQTIASPILKISEKLNNTFKKFKTLSPGFQLRNIFGGWTNQVLAGIPSSVATPFNPKQIKSLKLLSNATDLIDKSARGVLTKSEKAQYELLSEFIGAGFHNSTAKLYDIEEILNASSKNLPGKAIKKIAQVNNNMNQLMDSMYKMTLLDYFKTNPQALAKSGFDNPISAVKGILFSPSATDLSSFERNVMKRIVPFYTFSKQNLMFQFSNAVKNPVRYKQFVKGANMLWDNTFDEDEYQQWEKEGFLIPLPFLKDEDGKVISLKANLPLSDLGEYMSNPLGRIVASTSPLIKSPFEAVSGVDMFTGRELQDKNILEFAARNTGLDIFTKQIDKIGQLKEAGTLDSNTLATLMPSVARVIDPEKNITNNQYTELQQMQDYIKKLKDAGQTVRTINEIKAPMRLQIAKMKKARKKRGY